MPLRSLIALATGLIWSSRAGEIDLEGCTLTSTGEEVTSPCNFNFGKILLSEVQQKLDLKLAADYGLSVSHNGCCNGHTPRWTITLENNGHPGNEPVYSPNNKMAIRNLRTNVEFPILGVNHISAAVMYVWPTHDEAEYDALGGDKVLPKLFRAAFLPGDQFTFVTRTPATKPHFDVLNLELKVATLMEERGNPSSNRIVEGFKALTLAPDAWATVFQFNAAWAYQTVQGEISAVTGDWGCHGGASSRANFHISVQNSGSYNNRPGLVDYIYQSSDQNDSIFFRVRVTKDVHPREFVLESRISDRSGADGGVGCSATSPTQFYVKMHLAAGTVLGLD